MPKKPMEFGEYQGFEYVELELNRHMQNKGLKKSGQFKIFFPSGFRTVVKVATIKEVREFIDKTLDRGKKQDRSLKIKPRQKPKDEKSA